MSTQPIIKQYEKEEEYAPYYAFTYPNETGLPDEILISDLNLKELIKYIQDAGIQVPKEILPKSVWMKNPLTVYTLYACNEFRDTASYGRQFMITDLHNLYKKQLVLEALSLMDEEDLLDFDEDSSLHTAILAIKYADDYDEHYDDYINEVFDALCNQQIPYLDVKEHQILTDGSVEY